MDKQQQTQIDKEQRIQELIDELPVLMPQDEALFDKYGDWIVVPENQKPGYTEAAPQGRGRQGVRVRPGHGQS